MSISHLLFGRLTTLILLFCTLSPLSAAQNDPRALDPADVFFQAWLVIRDAEKLKKEGKINEARLKYKQAATYYNIITKFHKNYRPAMVANRVKTTAESIRELEAKALEEIAKKNARTRDFVEGGPSDPPNLDSSKKSGQGHQITPKRNTNSSSHVVRRTTNSTLTQADIYTQSINRGQLRRLQKLEQENIRLKSQLQHLRKTTHKNESAEQQRLIKIIAAKDVEISTIRNVLARAPLQSDMDKLIREKKRISMELEITAISLKGTRQKMAQLEKNSKKIQEEAALAIRREAMIKKAMKQQGETNNRIIRNLRNELKSITTVLKNTQRELGKSRAEISRLKKSLTQAEGTIKELKEERDALRAERNSLAAILKKNDASGIRKLISENMRLGKALKEKTDQLAYLEKQDNITKDELLEAKRDLAVAKTRIVRFQKERSRHAKRIIELQNQLRDAEAELALATDKKNKDVSQEEVEVLKETVKRLIAAQERQKTAEKILWEAVNKSNKIIPGVKEAINEIRSNDVTLTEEEKKLVVMRRPDSEFTSPGRVSPEHAKSYSTAMEKNIADYNRLVKRFYEKERYEAARQVLADMDEEFPGHFPTLCNRGVLELKTKHFSDAVEIFSEAVTMRENSSYAHYMLGVAHYQLGELDKARNEFQLSIDLKPNNARAHFYLGNLAGAGHRYKQAEKHFKVAIQFDPSMTEAYFNLSVLYLKQHKKKKALEAYRKALENGAAPNPEHEKKLSK